MILLLIGIIIGCFIGGFLSFFLEKKGKQPLVKNFEKITLQVRVLETRLVDQQKEYDKLITKLNTQEVQLFSLTGELAGTKVKNEGLLEKLVFQKQEMEKIWETSHLQFEKITNKILEEKTAKFTQVNQTNLSTILQPLEKSIENFKKKIEETYNKEAKERFWLGERVKELVQQTDKVSQEANNLASALKGQIKKQGDWGEVILENILQQSGLRKNQEYILQETISNEDGKLLRPDVLIKLPDNRIIIIDSKVSLVAYDRFASAKAEELQNLHLKEHLHSLRMHIDELSVKKYDCLDNSLDFTMMFIPIEPAYLIAIQHDDTLWNDAYSKRVLLISPTNLIACLKIINDLWKKEMQSRNAMEIVKQGSSLYEKLANFVDTFEKIGKQLEQTQDSYSKARNQLNSGKGNLITQAIKMKKLGLSPKKEIPISMLPIENDLEEIN